MKLKLVFLLGFSRKAEGTRTLKTGHVSLFVPFAHEAFTGAES